MNGYERMLAEQREEIERLRGLALMVAPGVEWHAFRRKWTRPAAIYATDPENEKAPAGPRGNYINGLQAE